MARFTLSALVVLLICLLAVPLAADIGKGGGGGQQLLRAIPDPASSFSFDEIDYIFLTDTISVPLYLNTDSAMTYLQTYFTWNTADLTFLSVTKGPGVPAGATFKDSTISGSVHSVTVLSPYNPFTIPEETPIAYVQYVVQCIGWGDYTTIEFTGGDDLNFFITGGLPYAPARTIGYVTTHDVGWKIIWSGYETVYPGEQNIELQWQYYQEIPGRVTDVRLLYDVDLLEILNVRPGPMLEGGTINWTTSADTIILSMPSSNPYQPVGQDTLFLIDARLKYCNDGYSTFINGLSGKRIDKCG